MFAIFCHENEIQRWKRSERWKYIHISSCRVQNNKEANYSKTKHYKPNKVTGKAILRKKNLEKLLLGKTQSCTPEEVSAHPWHEGCDSCQQGFRGKAHILRVLMPPARNLKGWSCSYFSEIFLFVHSSGWNSQATSIPPHLTVPGTSFSTPYPPHHKFLAQILTHFDQCQVVLSQPVPG